MDSVTQRAEAFVLALSGVLRSEREKAGLSKVELAARAGLSQPYVGLIESGARCPTADTLLRLAVALGVPLHGLVRDAEEGLPTPPAR